jgi:hypothetical protein
MNDNRTGRRISVEGHGDSLRQSRVPLTVASVGNLGDAYPTEAWEATYFSVDREGVLAPHRLTVRMLVGLADVCPQVWIGDPGCVYGVRRWGFALRPSALAAAGFDQYPAVAAGDDAQVLRAILQAAAFELPGEFIIGSPEHPFRLMAPDGTLRGSGTRWRTYLGALSFFASGGRVDASFIRFHAEAPASYRQAVDICLAALRPTAG